MYRWAAFILLLLWLLAQPYPLAANVNWLAPRQEHLHQTENAVAEQVYTACASPAALARNAPPIDNSRCLDDSPLLALSGLVQAADLIVRGQVTAVHSFWNADQRLIESDTTIAVAYALVGTPQRTLTVRTTGGFLATEGLGMVSMHEANFAVGEEVFAFVYQQDAVWRTVGGATGKFLVEQQVVHNPDLAMAQPLAGLVPTIIELLKQRGRQAQIPRIWQHLTPPTPATVPNATAPQTDKRKWTTPHATAAFAINLNTAQVDGEAGTRAEFRQAIIAAAASWSQVPAVDFRLRYSGETTATQTGFNGVNEVLFMHQGAQERAAAAQVWFTADGTIVEADIWINDDYAWNATGSPAVDEVDLQSALLHEFGHWLILGHCADSYAVMFAKLTAGTLKRTLQQSDIAGIRAIYPR